MTLEPMEPFGRALLDYHGGRDGSVLYVHRNDGLVEEMSVAMFFRAPSQFAEDEQQIIECCRAPVLDFGAGAGCHSLALQERGLRVTSIDISPQAVEVMIRRGVQDARHADAFEFSGGPYATIVMAGRAVCMAGTLLGLDRLLVRIRGLLALDGQVLLDSLDVRKTQDPRHLAYQEANRRAGRYVGEVRCHFEYGEHRGEEFGILHVDPDTLADHAAGAGLASEVIRLRAEGGYVARLGVVPPITAVGCSCPTRA